MGRLLDGVKATLAAMPPGEDYIPPLQDCPRCSIKGYGNRGYRQPTITRGRRAGRYLVNACCPFSAKLAKESWETQEEIIEAWNKILSK